MITDFEMFGSGFFEFFGEYQYLCEITDYFLGLDIEPSILDEVDTIFTRIG